MTNLNNSARSIVEYLCAICLILLFQIVIFSPLPATAGEWPADAKARMEAAGARLGAATDTAQRVAALREIQKIAAANQGVDGARLTAKLLSEKATQEAGPGTMLDALGALAASGEITDAQAYASIVGPLMDTIGQMQDNKTLLPEAAIQLDKAVQKLNSAAAKAGLPSIADAISQATGDDKLGAAVTNTLSRLAKFAELSRKTSDLAKMDKEATTQYIYEWLEAAAALGGPAINSVAAVPYAQVLGWNNEMYGQSSQALNLVADAIETGKFDHKAYNKIRDRLKELSKGPWSSDTLKDMFKKLCKSIPLAGAWCDDAFNLAEELVGVSCDQVTCDCENVGGGLMRGPLIVQCKIQEQDLISECNATKKVTGKCQGDAKGPGASH